MSIYLLALELFDPSRRLPQLPHFCCTRQLYRCCMLDLRRWLIALEGLGGCCVRLLYICCSRPSTSTTTSRHFRPPRCRGNGGDRCYYARWCVRRAAGGELVAAVTVESIQKPLSSCKPRWSLVVIPQSKLRLPALAEPLLLTRPMTAGLQLVVSNLLARI